MLDNTYQKEGKGENSAQVSVRIRYFESRSYKEKKMTIIFGEGQGGLICDFSLTNSCTAASDKEMCDRAIAALCGWVGVLVVAVQR
jgi:hypothetical protein